MGIGDSMSVNVLVSQGSKSWARRLDDSMERWRLRHQVDFPDWNHSRGMKVSEFGKVLKDDSITYRMLVELKMEMLPFLTEGREAAKAARASKNDPNTRMSKKKYFQIYNGYKALVKNINAIDAEIARRKRLPDFSRGHLPSRGLSHYIVDVTRETIDSYLFTTILEEAKKRKEEDSKTVESNLKQKLLK